jgi:hypothetical protein
VSLCLYAPFQHRSAPYPHVLSKANTQSMLSQSSEFADSKITIAFVPLVLCSTVFTDLHDR